MPTDGSVSRRINAERLVLLGWTRAILLQLAHPLVAAGVHEHSSFRASPWAAVTRLRATVRAMLALTFGTEEERQRSLDGIRAIHRRVNGHLPDAVGPFAAGTPYSAEDPALVMWVHVTLLESFPLAYETFVAPISEVDRDVYCAEAADVAVALGARSGDVPRTWSDARAYLERAYSSGTIVVGPQARELAAVLMAPPIATPLPPIRWMHRLVTVGLLPAPLRTQYGFEWTGRTQRAFDTLAPLVRRTRVVTPGRAALWPEARSPRHPNPTTNSV